MSKYSVLEIERRWLVSLDSLPALDELQARIIEDTYLLFGRLRLRRITSNNGEILKLCKKYPQQGQGFESITNIYLSKDEFVALSCLEGLSVKKARYPVEEGSIDVYDFIAIFEVEFLTTEEAANYTPPEFVSQEVTGDPDYSGFALAQAASA